MHQRNQSIVCSNISHKHIRQFMFPLFYENSKIPVLLSKLAPIEIYALSFGVWVWCRGIMSDRIKRHETIHYLQQLELLFVGQWLLYGIFHLINMWKYRGDGRKAYRENPFEREAYANDEQEKMGLGELPIKFFNARRTSSIRLRSTALDP